MKNNCLQTGNTEYTSQPLIRKMPRNVIIIGPLLKVMLKVRQQSVPAYRGQEMPDVQAATDTTIETATTTMPIATATAITITNLLNAF